MTDDADQHRRAASASSYWARQSGNFLLFVKFDKEDAYQTARLALVKEPHLGVLALYNKIQDAVRTMVAGYKQRRLLEAPMAAAIGGVGLVERTIDDDCLPTSLCTAAQSIRYIRSDPRREELAEWTLAGVPAVEIARRRGVDPSRVWQLQNELVQSLLQEKPNIHHVERGRV